MNTPCQSGIGKTTSAVVVFLDEEISFVISEGGLRMKLGVGHFQWIDIILIEIRRGLLQRTVEFVGNNN